MQVKNFSESIYKIVAIFYLTLFYWLKSIVIYISIAKTIKTDIKK